MAGNKEDRKKITKKILIIDDDALVRETVSLALRHAGFDVSTLESPTLAQTVVRQGKPDLILLDLYMPELDGRELCRRLKEDPETKAIPVVVFTGSNETIDIVSGAAAGAFDYITKPIDPRALVAKISYLLDVPEVKKDANG